jgi:hypothetical protein
MKLAKRGYEISILSMFGCMPFFEISDSIKLEAVFEDKRNLKLILPFAIYKIRHKIATLSPDVIINVDSALFIYSHVASVGMGI